MKHTTWLGAWLSALILSGAGLAARLWMNFTYPPQELFGTLTQLLGVPAMFQLIHTIFGFGQGGKTFAFLGVLILWLGGLTLIGRYLNAPLGALLLGLTLTLLVPWPVAIAYAALYLIARVIVHGALTSASSVDAPRRQVLTALWGGSALLVAGGLTGLLRSVSSGAPAAAALGPNGELPAGVTPTKDFYYVSKNLEPFDPTVSADTWKLEVTGMVNTPLALSLADVQAMPSRTLELTLACISNPVGGPLMGNALWTGFPVADLLRRAGVKGGAKYIVWRAADGYEESLPLGEAFEDDVMLVHAMNGQPLSKKHGFPLRVLIPGRYGMKQPRWITSIHLTSDYTPGYWVKRGWSKTARVEITSRIDEPQEINPTVKAGEARVIRGIAFGGLNPITKVEVTTDGGRTWREATLTTPRSRHAWTLWELPWTPKPGGHELIARAYSGDTMQKQTEKDALPEGAMGWHHFIVTAS